MKNILRILFFHASRGRDRIMWPSGCHKENIDFETRKKVIDAFNVIGRFVKEYKDKLKNITS